MTPAGYVRLTVGGAAPLVSVEDARLLAGDWGLAGSAFLVASGELVAGEDGEPEPVFARVDPAAVARPDPQRSAAIRGLRPRPA